MKFAKIYSLISKREIRLFSYCGILIIAITLRLTTSHTALLDADSAGYLEPALSFLQSQDFHLQSRSYPYPLFLLGILSLFKDISAVLFVQHFIAITVLILSFFLFEQTLKNVKNKQTFTVRFLLGNIFLAACFWNDQLILFEKTIRPEGILLPCLCIYLFILYRFINQLKKGAFSKKTFYVISFLSVLFALMHPRMTLAFYGIPILFFAFYSFNKSFSLKGKTQVFLILVTIGIAVVLPHRYLVEKYNSSHKHFAYQQFYFSSFSEIQKVINRSDYVNKIFDSIYFPELYKETIEKTEHLEWWKILGYNLDIPQYELFDNPYYSNVKSQLSINNNEYFKEWFWKMNVQYPYLVLLKISKQLFSLYFYYNIMGYTKILMV